MKLLVTGGAGFIGSNFTRYWLAHHADDQVVVLDSLTYAGDKANLKGLDASRVSFIRGSINSPAAVKFAMADVDVVVHFAAESHVDRSIKSSDLFLKTNLLGTQVLLDEARRRDGQIIRFHHVSTDEVYGSLDLSDSRRFNETTPYAPRSPYAASKAASDHLVRAYFNTYGVPTTITNCSNNYGPYQHPEKFMPTVIGSALFDTPIPIYGDGLYVRDWMHVEDHCRGIEAAILHGRPGESYCLGGNAERTNLEICRAVLNMLGKPLTLVKHVTDRPGHDRRYAVDSAKAERELGWKPRWKFEDGLKDTVGWFRMNQPLWLPRLNKKTEK
jgi:dTDP-glucose 4,6-dehydratase